MGEAMNDKLYDLIIQYQKMGGEFFIPIYKRFTPLIRKYARKLNYDGADTDLVIGLLEIVKKIPICYNKKLLNEAAIVGYISTALKNKYIYLSRKQSLINSHEVPLDVNLNFRYSLASFDDRIFVKILLGKLTSKERKVLVLKYITGYSDVEIALFLNISRQAINKTKNRALKNLKKYA